MLLKIYPKKSQSEQSGEKNNFLMLPYIFRQCTSSIFRNVCGWVRFTKKSNQPLLRPGWRQVAVHKIIIILSSCHKRRSQPIIYNGTLGPLCKIFPHPLVCLRIIDCGERAASMYSYQINLVLTDTQRRKIKIIFRRYLWGPRSRVRPCLTLCLATQHASGNFCCMCQSFSPTHQGFGTLEQISKIPPFVWQKITQWRWNGRFPFSCLFLQSFYF